MPKSSQTAARHSRNKEKIKEDEAFRLNPFSAEMLSPQQNKYVFACGDQLELAAERLLKILDKFLVASIIGRHGMGKTTLIYSLIPLLNSLGITTSLLRLGKQSWQNTIDSAYEQLSSVPLGFYGSSMPSRHCLIVDGFEQLPIFGKLALVTAIRSYNRLLFNGYRSSTTPNLFMLISAHRKQLMIPVFEKIEWKPDLAMRLTLDKIKLCPEWLQKEIILIASEECKKFDSRRSSACFRDFWLLLYDGYENLVTQRAHAMRDSSKGHIFRK